MISDLVSLTQKLLSLKTVPGNTKELNESLDLCLSYLLDYNIEYFEHQGVKSALVFNTADRDKEFDVLLNCHLDIITPKESQYQSYIEGDRLYGAGVMDMKANLVCALFAFSHVAKKTDKRLALQLVTDEEVGGFLGTKYQVDQGVRSNFVLATEPTNFNIVNQAKGVLWLKIKSTGKTAHGAYPWRGDNAIWKMFQFLEVLKNTYPIPESEVWATTLNLSSIETTNTALNKIPDDCSISLDIRCIPEDEKIILDRIKSLLPQGFEIEVLANESALYTSLDDKNIIALQNIVEEKRLIRPFTYGAQGSSDARHFNKVGCKGVEFGPIGGGIGEDNEWVDIPSLEIYYEVLKTFLLYK